MTPERTPTGFGQLLREARERRGLSLRQIANATKISMAVLEALERNDISKLPGGIFGRAFVRSYAIEVGLDPETTIQRFIAQFPNDSVVAGHPVSDQVEDHVAVESDRQTAGTFLWLIVIAVPVAAGLLYFATLGRRTATEAPAPAAAAPRPPELAAAPDRAPSPAPVESAALVPAAVTAAAADVRPAATTPADTLTIALTVTRPCWVSATVDGRKTIERLLQPGEQQTVAVRREMVLTAGDAAAISLQFNGAGGRPLGKSGEVVTARFTLTNYKDYLQAR
jgi:cytoskeleton protein RodZ